MTAGDGQPGLPPFQLEVARMFFALPASRGFLLAGGAALLAQHLTARPTEDLDFFTALSAGMFPPHAMPWRPRPASEAGSPSGSTTVTRSAGWSSAALTTGVLIDLAVNAPPDLPASATPARPRPNCELSTRLGDRSSKHKPGSAGPSLIQQTAGQMLQAHFWHLTSQGGGRSDLAVSRCPAFQEGVVGGDRVVAGLAGGAQALAELGRDPLHGAGLSGCARRAMWALGL
jgi:hypothetical protein